MKDTHKIENDRVRLSNIYIFHNNSKMHHHDHIQHLTFPPSSDQPRPNWKRNLHDTVSIRYVVFVNVIRVVCIGRIMPR